MDYIAEQLQPSWLGMTFPEKGSHVKQVTRFYTMHSILDIDNMRAVGEFSSVGDLILVAHKLTSACTCKGRLDKPQVFLFITSIYTRLKFIR